jgi:hypothetical protein
MASCGGAAGTPATTSPASLTPPPDVAYYVYVGAESADLIHRIKLDATGVSVDRTTPVGEMAVENEGPHGLNVSPDGRYLYMTTAHGVPDGKMWKFAAGPDTLVAAPILLGNFPATLDLTPDGLYAFIANFNLHGEHVPSTVSVVYTPDMVEVEQIPKQEEKHGAQEYRPEHRIDIDGPEISTAVIPDPFARLVLADLQVLQMVRDVLAGGLRAVAAFTRHRSFSCSRSCAARLSSTSPQKSSIVPR